MMACGFLLVVTLAIAITFCHGYANQMHHLVLLENLPPQFAKNETPEIVIRTNYSGLVYFKESNDFKVLLNITAPSIDQAYAVHSQLIEDKGRLLIQVYEEQPKGAPISLSLIFLVVGVSTGIVALLAMIYAMWWYCAKKYKDIEEDNFTHGNVMYRVRNSMHLSSTQAEEILLSREEDNDNVHNEDTLREVPEMPEEEEAEALEMAEMKATERHDNEESKKIKKRYHSSAKRINKEFYRKDMARRKRHPSLNDPPSYDAVMEYPNGSSDESDGGNDGANRKLLPIQGSDSTIGDRTYQNVYRDGAITIFKNLDTHIPVAHSDGDLTIGHLGQRRGHQLPRLAKGLVTPPVPGSADFEQGQLARVDRIENCNAKASREAMASGVNNNSSFIQTSQQGLNESSNGRNSRQGNNESPFGRTSRHENNESPYGRTSRQGNNDSPFSRTSRPGNDSPFTPLTREMMNESPYGRTRARNVSPYQQPLYEGIQQESPYSRPSISSSRGSREGAVSPYRRSKEQLPREDNASPYARVSRQNSSASSHRTSRESAASPFRSPREDGNSSPFRVTADVHQTTPISPDSPMGQYMQIKPQLSGSPQPTTSTVDSGICTMEKHPMDIPLTSFKVPPVVPPKPVRFIGDTPEKEHFYDFQQWEGTNDPYPTPTVPSNPSSPGGHRFSLMSDKTLSMYGSSEIFDANNPARHNDFEGEDSESDIDVEVPALDSDADILSDASLPLPSPPAYVRIPGAGMKFDGSPISPAARKFLYGEGELGVVSAMSPNEDWEDMRGGRLIAATASPTNTLDKHFIFPPPGQSQDSGMSEDLGFSSHPEPGYPGEEYYFTSNENKRTDLLPPPPPKLHRPPQRYSWTREEGRDQRQTNTEQNEQEQRHRHKSGGRGGRAPMGPKHLHLTILSTVCVLSLVTGVYCRLQESEIEVHITVYAPKHMLTTHQIQVYFNQYKRGDIGDSKYKVQAYDVSEPVLWNMNSSLCHGHSCIQGCDENTGRCICKKGYKLNSVGKCVDVNECRERTFRCHKDAGCLNTRGSYHCMCSGTFYGDGKSCEECAAACKDNMFEVQPCSNKQPKICRACTQVCYHGYYMLKQCSTNRDADCRMCHQKCSAEMFEYKQCTKKQNRECKARTELRAPDASGNLIIENQMEVEGDDVEMPFTPSDFNNVRRITFKRGSGFYIDLAVTYLNPELTFDPVDHSQNNDLRSFPGSSNIIKSHCPYPVPVHYELHYIKHRSQMFKTEFIPTKGSVIAPCETYTQHGQFPDQSQTDAGTILCAGPGPLTNLFLMKRQVRSHKDTWVESLERCININDGCLNCTRGCALHMRHSQGDCIVRQDDNGDSPRLPTCFTCCAHSNCSDACVYYHVRGCMSVKCKTGDLIEFRLRPVYNSVDDYLCHIKPIQDQKLLQLQYTIMHYHSAEITGSISIHGNEEWRTRGRTSHSDNVVKVNIDSKLGKMPNIVQGTLRNKDVRVGVYKHNGENSAKVENANARGSSILVRPIHPFKMTSPMFGSKTCEDVPLGDLVLATGSEDPYIPIAELAGEYKGNTSFVITNKTHYPTIRIGISKHTSILNALYPQAKLMFNTLKGNIKHNSTHWIVGVFGKISSCPGLLSMNISDPEYSAEPLFTYEIGIKCPNVFNITYAIPNGDKPYIDKDFIVTVKDQLTTYYLNIYKPSSRFIQGSSGHTGKVSFITFNKANVATPPHFSIPFIASVCGGTLLLLFIAAFGIAVKFNQPRSDVLRFHWCHLILLIGYVTFQFLFAICASMTAFVLIVVAVNSDTATFLKNYQEQRSVKTAYSHLELDYMEHHLQNEIDRQNGIAKQSKAQCEIQMQKIIQDFDHLKIKMEKQVKANIESQNLKNLLGVHSRELLNNFKNNLDIFHDRFTNLVKQTQETFAADIRETYKSVQKNRWLAGANFLHRTVKNLRDFLKLPTKPFMKWTGIKDNLTKADTVINLPIHPNFHVDYRSGPSADNLQQAPNKPTRTNPDVKTVEMHNIWMYRSRPDYSHKQTNLHNETVNQPQVKTAGSKEELTILDSYMVFFVVMVFIDVVWFLHRVLKALGVSRLLLFGYPIFLDIRDKTARSRHPSESEAYVRKKKRWFKSGFLASMKEFLFKMLSSMFVPKVICTILVCLIVYVVSMATIHFVNRETFSYLGYYNNVDDLLKANENFINNRIISHGHRINMLEYPAYQELMNMHTQRHHYVYRMVERQWLALESAHNQLYCKYLQQLDVNARCRDPSRPEFGDSQQISTCYLQQIDPQLYHRRRGAESTVAEMQMDAFLTSIRKLISDTCYIVLIYLSVIIVKELLGTVIWLYMKRSGLINLRIIYEADEPPVARER